MKQITKQMIYIWAKYMRLDARRMSSATHKKHKHVEGEQFKSINPSGVTPAEYRHDHYVMRDGKLYQREKKRSYK